MVNSKLFTSPSVKFLTYLENFILGDLNLHSHMRNVIRPLTDGKQKALYHGVTTSKNKGVLLR